MVKLVGIDASSKKTGLALMVNGKLDDFRLVDFSAFKDREMRMELMCKELLHALDKWQPDIVYIEDSWNANNVEVTKLLTRIMGVVYGWCLQNEKEWHAILPAQWRKYCGIENGHKKRAELKQASIDYVQDTYGILVNDDVADAIALADGVLKHFDEIV